MSYRFLSVAALLALIGCSPYRSSVVVYQSTFGAPDGLLVGVNYGIREDRVDYIVFDIGHRAMSNRVHGELISTRTGGSYGTQYLTVKDKVITLPGSAKAFE